MAQPSIGDLSQSLLLRTHTMRLKTEVNLRSQEVSTGKVSDLSAAVSGDFAPLSGIEASLTSLSALETGRKEAELFVSTTQSSLQKLQDQARAFAPSVMAAADGTTDANTFSALAADAKQRFQSAVATLNTTVAGQALFSGDATGTQALQPAEQVFNAFASSGAASATTFSAVKEDLESVTCPSDSVTSPPSVSYYQGSSAPRGAVPIAPGEQASLTLDAQDPAFRDMLKGYAAARLLGEGRLPPAENAKLAKFAGETLFEAESQLTARAAETGVIEARLADAETRNSAEKASLEQARNEIVAVDPYEAATKLEDARLHLETHFAVTARLSNLSLTNFLR